MIYDSAEKIEAKEILIERDELFIEMIHQLDSWNGFADNFRCYPMDELDEICYGMKFSEFLEKVIGNHFDFSDDYFCLNDDGIFSVEDIAEFYHDNVSESELLENIISEYENLWFPVDDEDFYDLIVKIAEGES